MEISPEVMPVTQYHFNTRELNTFLSDKCTQIGISQYDDKIKEVVLDKDGVDKLIGSSEYKYDFYIDCTGFAKLLIGKLGAEWQSYSQYLKMKRGIVC